MLAGARCSKALAAAVPVHKQSLGVSTQTPVAQIKQISLDMSSCLGNIPRAVGLQGTHFRGGTRHDHMTWNHPPQGLEKSQQALVWATAQRGGWRATCVTQMINDDHLQRGCLEMMQRDVWWASMRLGCLPVCWYILSFKKAHTHTHTQIHTPLHIEPGSRTKESRHDTDY